MSVVMTVSSTTAASSPAGERGREVGRESSEGVALVHGRTTTAG